MNDHKPLLSLFSEKKAVHAPASVHLLPSSNSSTTIQCLWSIFATISLLEVKITDNGPSSTSGEFETLKKEWCEAQEDPALPSNGFAERAVQIVKKGLKLTKN